MLLLTRLSLAFLLKLKQNFMLLASRCSNRA
jgi:hypothetical protein